MFGHPSHGHVTGLYYTEAVNSWTIQRHYLPQLELSVSTHIVGSSSRTTLTQTFVNPSAEKSIPELRYTFPLYDGVSVVGFVCTINEDRVIRGVVKERYEARKQYQEAIDRGETAGLLEQLPNASDVFTTTVGNVPAGASLKVEVTYLGELKNDAGVDGIRYTIPTSVAPRYGDFPGTLLDAPQAVAKSGIQITVDVETPGGSNIKSIQSPSHPISVTIGHTSSGAAAGTDMSLQKASATLALGTAELAQDFILQVVATNTGNPIALLETHTDIPHQRALMATLVPKFNLPSTRPEIVFVCDRSGSMGGARIEGLKSALRIFLKSIPVGAKFNICSFGSTFEFLFSDGSRSYDHESLRLAMDYVSRMDADLGGTEMYQPLEAAFEKRYNDMDLEVFLLTDGEIWNQEHLFTMINKKVSESQGAIRLFTLGIGNDVSHALIEGAARAGNGFAQSVTDSEKMNAKVVRMLKAGLTPHIKDYTLEIKYAKDSDAGAKTTDEEMDDFEIVEKVSDALAIRLADGADKPNEPVKPISLFDASVDLDIEMPDADADLSLGEKFSHVPPVPEPTILQAPFTIPPLYPFIRTSVYLLLSPSTAQKTPKSVILRATSAHGPLELEIPVAVLEEKGQTIHQLAARKAVQELEEGRGWIYHATDSSDPDQKLLKDKYEGRFSDMVEREAVRLGVTFQVGSKWCSYVAVEEKDRTEHEVNQRVPEAASDKSSESFESKPVVRSRRMGRFSARLASSPTENVVETCFFDTQRMPAPFSPASPSYFPASPSYSPASPPGSALFSVNPAPLADHSRPMASPPGQIKAARMGSITAFGATSNSPGTAFGNAASNSFGGGRFGAPAISRRIPEAHHFGFPVSNSSDSAQVEPETATPLEPLEALVSLQHFDGSWSWTEKLLDILGQSQLTEEKVEECYGVSMPNTDMLATALVLAYLEAKLVEERDEWEMLADKAREWLKSELTKSSEKGVVSSVEELVEKLKACL
ncbi:von Willebrand domain-containing protein, variant [Neurospora crassa OR74A]|uniref:von Willebrand domain-containing protein, variant n=1 Tax=Neurospora crassa (strain ATCC 24698 / 74-OR23-1A / CBS 708.71 / DSM 1257 / FGSC 987) TaxID=367110 RepID=V5IQB3_NEUCR|nr:von Willebrand domain-containing protein, variant [Neurospora crassa OR74A]ESA44202.1 von Willebrand domain-containing protein, variant [Neurospora crassa OR74A]|eukprot:XP_011392876.1 von Willebrand domain-containing protein, variant [Neurospora crassa OR74A]